VDVFFLQSLLHLWIMTHADWHMGLPSLDPWWWVSHGHSERVFASPLAHCTDNYPLSETPRPICLPSRWLPGNRREAVGRLNVWGSEEELSATSWEGRGSDKASGSSSCVHSIHRTVNLSVGTNTVSSQTWGSALFRGGKQVLEWWKEPKCLPGHRVDSHSIVGCIIAQFITKLRVPS
jgi:hypothetical protein